MCTKFQVCTIFSSLFLQKNVMKTVRTLFSKNSADQGFYDISIRLLSAMHRCPRYPQKNFHKNLISQFCCTGVQLKNHLFLDIVKTKRKPVMKTVLKRERERERERETDFICHKIVIQKYYNRIQ